MDSRRVGRRLDGFRSSPAGHTRWACVPGNYRYGLAGRGRVERGERG